MLSEQINFSTNKAQMLAMGELHAVAVRDGMRGCEVGPRSARGGD